MTKNTRFFLEARQRAVHQALSITQIKAHPHHVQVPQGGSLFVSAFEAFTLKPPALPEATYSINLF
ncbi:TPA: hypothetical protein ACGE8T_004234 [Klebsiella pneumoniae]